MDNIDSAKHKDYIFDVFIEPVNVNSIELISHAESLSGRANLLQEEVEDYVTEQHELIYTDGHIAVTLYECCYGIWHVWKQCTTNIGGSLWKPGQFKLSDESIKKIKNYMASK